MLCTRVKKFKFTHCSLTPIFLDSHMYMLLLAKLARCYTVDVDGDWFSYCIVWASRYTNAGLLYDIPIMGY